MMNIAPDSQTRGTLSFSQLHRLSLIALLIGVAPAGGCALDDAGTGAPAEAPPAGASSLDFGGAFGSAGGRIVPNPATGAASCPDGYTAAQVLDPLPQLGVLRLDLSELLRQRTQAR